MAFQAVAPTLDGNPPPRKSVLTSNDHGIPAQYLDLFPQLFESLQKARLRPRTAHWRGIEKCLGDELQKLINGESDIDGFVARTNTRLASPDCK
jgi:hypothetical protein